MDTITLKRGTRAENAQNNEAAEGSVKKRLSDRLWRVNHLYTIQTKDGEEVQFKMNAVQKLLYGSMHFRNIILKSRQLGISTFIAILFMDECIFRANTKAAIVADKEANAKKIFEKIVFAWRHFPNDLKEALGISVTNLSTSEISFSNGSGIVVGTTIHSGTYQMLHLSEYGPLCADSPEKAQKVKKSAIPTVPKNGVIFVESTAEGEDDDFNVMWNEAVATRDRIEQSLAGMFKDEEGNEKTFKWLPLQFKPFFFPWYEDPHNTLEGEVPVSREMELYFKDLKEVHGISLTKEQKNWYVLTKQDLKSEMFQQHPTLPEEAFRSSKDRQFPDSVTKELKRFTIPPIEIIDDIMIWKHYKLGHRYALGADVAEGIGEDSSTIAVIDFTENEVVATYKNNAISPLDFAEVIRRVGTMYGTCLAAPEANNVGHTTCAKLNEIYPRVYKFVSNAEAQPRTTKRLGWVTSGATKPKMTWDLSAAFQADKPLRIYDLSAIREMTQYNKRDNAIVTSAHRATTTRHFDLLMAIAIAWQMAPYADFGVQGTEQAERIRERRARAKTGELGFR